ncbi:CoA-binding domain protein [Natrinema pellirubrum DSM 15624]|uniref:CoA-binding domain protein n=1 Tax=Natrinema pellirubrum (strain DSM 15624 / CIP 106293 / JCM 10476 / NCIMB 786 / 157) TaxID=797303 RepID=L0JNW4_NATP1|nr:CoA-binding protein [Natrinema pellirubrum]AGB32533.1 putative CoA-binding protein [Natrinema pellirubrum DSM 15624]ELY73671.1 CoA-binding domain protein [Natrinema pellirubrum DSM 15624]
MPVDTAAEIEEILESDTIAVVGCSSTPGKAAHDVPKYLLNHGYDVIPVNPYAEEIFGREVYDSLADVEDEIDVVCIFRPSEEVSGIVDAALERDDIDVIWTQQGIRDDEAAARAETAGRSVVQDRCMKVQHRRLVA